MSGSIETPEGGNKRIALLIALLALMLAFSEIGGKNAEQEAVAKNIEASNLWAFFQAKTIRGTTVRTAAEAAALCGRPQKTVEAQIYRAKKMLAEQIRQERRSEDGIVS